MMKQIIFILCCLTAAQVLYAQEPCPSWAKNEPVAPSDVNYVYISGMGIGYTREEAKDKAWADALKNAMHRAGLVDFDRQVLSKETLKGEVVSNQIARNPKCYEEVPTKDGMIKAYMLFQVQKRAAEPVDFAEKDFVVCYSESFHKEKMKWEEGIYPFSPRVFVPGMAQIYKGTKGKGIAFIVGEVVMIGGIVLFEGLRSSYESKINTTHNAADRQSYIDDANAMQNVRNGFIAGAAALYIWNVIDGIVAKGKPPIPIGKNAYMQITPYAAPQTSGVAMTIKF